jgi:hypothetical protein
MKIAKTTVTRLLNDKTIIEDRPEQNRCGDIWKLINPETKEVVSPESNDPKQWVHTDY